MEAAETPLPERLDQYVVRQLPKLSRAAAVRLVEDGKVLVNGQPATKAGYKLRPDDTVEIAYEAAVSPEVPIIDLPVIYEDRSCVVIDKPTGLLTHSKGAFNPEATVATWLGDRAKDMAGERAGIVHRLDRATSGVMIVAKTPEALAWLQKQFSQRKVKKVYRAVVSGVPSKEQAVIDMPIERNPRKPQTFRVGANGKAAVTAYKIIKTNGQLSLLELRPETGRTHQLRVHLQHIGHPIIGDTLYGGARADRLFLHAESLEITLPSKDRKTFSTAMPEIFDEVIR
jgi:23S rRNA pseudouridine1911/1915/1917 synthase